MAGGTGYADGRARRLEVALASAADTDPIRRRFEERFIRGSVSECWLWTGAKAKKGYGTFHVHEGGDTWLAILAHRLAWQFANGAPIPDRCIVRHSCDTRACVNPAHLLIGTHAENVADRVIRGRGSIGERQAKAKLTAEIVREVRASKASTGSLARKHGVSKVTMKNARTGITWAFVQ